LRPCPSSSMRKNVRGTNAPSKASARRGVISGQMSAPGAKAVPLNPAGRSPAGRKFDGKSHGVRNLAEIRPRVAKFVRVNGVNCVVGMASAAG